MWQQEIIVFLICPRKHVTCISTHNESPRHITKTRLFKYIENFSTKNWKFSGKNSYIFHISAQNIDCVDSLEPPHWGGSNEYPQSMFLSRYKKNNVYSCKPQFSCIKVGFKRSKLYRYVFVMICGAIGNTIRTFLFFLLLLLKRWFIWAVWHFLQIAIKESKLLWSQNQ